MPPKPTYEQLLKRIEKLEESERGYRSLVDNTADLLYRTDLKGRIVFISNSVQELAGYTVEETIGLNMAEEVYLIPEEREKFLALLAKNGRVRNFEAQLKRKDGSVWWASTNAHLFRDKNGNVAGVEGITRDITELKKGQGEQRKLIMESQEAISKVHTLSGLLPICSSCKKIRDDRGYWNQLESYIHDHSNAQVSHGLCPECSDRIYGKEEWYIKMKEKQAKDQG